MSLHGLGAIESNVDKLAANRMKERVISWTIKGAKRIARLISLRQMGQLHSQITRKDKSKDSQLLGAEVNKKRTNRNRDTGTRLEAELPALYGPHQNCHWDQALKTLTCRILEV